MVEPRTNISLDKDPFFWRLCLTVTIFSITFALYSLGKPESGLSRFVTSLKWGMVAITGLLLILGLLTILILSWTSLWESVRQGMRSAYQWIGSLKWLNLLPFTILLLIFITLIFQPITGLFEERDLFDEIGLRVSCLWLFAAAASPFLSGLFPSLGKGRTLLGSIFIFMLFYKLFTFIPEISNYPFSLSWSEGSRYYYASLFYSQQLYGLKLPWSFLHPSRYLLQSIPFLISDLPIWVHRLWQVMLWMGLTGLTAFFLQRRLGLQDRRLRWLVLLWAFFFLFQGPVYYHLLVSAMIVLWGFDKTRFWRSFLWIVIASAWAGISRVNWFPVPAMLAISLFVIENDYRSVGNFWRYWRDPAFYGIVGVVTALGGQAAYIALSGQGESSYFASSFSSDLLWYRLLPSATYPPGILPMILLLSLPLIILIVGNLWLRCWNAWRILALTGMLLILFVGGLVVSTKIGGGGNLHNMDGYLLLLMVWGSFFWAGKFVKDRSQQGNWKPGLLVLLAAVLPFYPLLSEGGPLPTRDQAGVQAELESIQALSNQAAAQGDKVLFIGQRHLITFDLIDLALEPEYELLELMEMAMSDNQEYLLAFYRDLREQKYSMIIADPQRILLKDFSFSFPEENNVWVEKVSIPLLEFYQAADRFPQSGVQIFYPKE